MLVTTIIHVQKTVYLNNRLASCDKVIGDGSDTSSITVRGFEIEKFRTKTNTINSRLSCIRLMSVQRLKRTKITSLDVKIAKMVLPSSDFIYYPRFLPKQNNLKWKSRENLWKFDEYLHFKIRSINDRKQRMIKSQLLETGSNLANVPHLVVVHFNILTNSFSVFLMIATFTGLHKLKMQFLWCKDFQEIRFFSVSRLFS